jgi:carboxyl-terminal processing protease
MPDYFVPRDTSEYTPYLNKVINYSYLYQFAFQYTDQNRAKLNTYKSWQQMGAYLDSQDLLGKFTAFAKTKGVQPNPRDIAISKRMITNLLQSYITRNVLGDDGFYPLFYKYDKTVAKGLEVVKQQK